MCHDSCAHNTECRMFGKELSECLESGKQPKITDATVVCCGGTYVGPQFEMTLPSGRALWMRMGHAYERGLFDALSEYACKVLRVMDCPKQAAAVRWLEYCQKLCSAKDHLHQNEMKALNEQDFRKTKTTKNKIVELEKQLQWEHDKLDRAKAMAKKLETELLQLRSEVAKAAARAENIAKGHVSNETKIKRKPLKYLDSALKIIEHRLHAPNTASVPAPTDNASPKDDARPKEVVAVRAENEALKARLATVSQELDAERTLSGNQAEELDRLRTTVKKQEKLDKKNKKKGHA